MNIATVKIATDARLIEADHLLGLECAGDRKRHFLLFMIGRRRRDGKSTGVATELGPHRICTGILSTHGRDLERRNVVQASRRERPVRWEPQSSYMGFLRQSGTGYDGASVVSTAKLSGPSPRCHLSHMVR